MRIEGYLPRDEFRAQLEMGLARVAFMNKKWSEAERRYAEVAERYPQTTAAPEALYWKTVSTYKSTNDHAVLGEVVGQLRDSYPESVWALKALPWSH